MKFFVAIALLAVTASAAVIPTQKFELEQIVAAINSPSTDPATAAALEALLLDIMGPSPISVGPALVETSPISVGPALVETSPISVGPALIDFPIPDGGAVTAEEPAVAPIAVVEPVQPSPVIIGEIPAGSSPLVQIIVNVIQAETAEAPINVPTPVVAPEPVVEEVFVPGPVNIVDNIVIAPVEPENVVEEIFVPGPVNVVDSPVTVVDPVQVITPVIVAPVQVGTPVLPEPIVPSPAVILPEILN